MIRDDELQAAVEAGIIGADTRDRLVAFVNAQARTAPDAAPRPKFDVSHVLWYAGALIIITAMGLFSTAACSSSSLIIGPHPSAPANLATFCTDARMIAPSGR